MFKRIPSKFSSDNRGERQVFAALEGLFPGKTYYALHSVGLAGHRSKRQGEADFVLVTDFGIFCLEVKSGRVHRTPDGIWKYEGYEKNESPFKQAEGTVYPLEDLLGERDRQRRNKFVFGWGVIFTDIPFDIRDPEWVEQQVCDENRFPHRFEEYIRNLGEHFKERLSARKGITLSKPITADDMKWAIKSIRPDFARFSVNDLQNSKAEVIQLENQLVVYVDQLVGVSGHKSVIKGAAGAGKTVLVREAVERIPDEKSILVICFNALLAKQLRFLFLHKRNVVALHYHSLLRMLFSTKGNLLSSEVRGETAEHSEFQDAVGEEQDANWFSEYSSKLQDRLLEEDISKFDWVIVDEGQDFLDEEMFENLSLLQKDGWNDGNFIIALDHATQSRVYNRLDSDLLKRIERQCNRTIELPRNYRNPSTLARRAQDIAGLANVAVERKTPSPPFIHNISEDDKTFSSVQKFISNLLEKGIKPEEITILTLASRKKSTFVNCKNISGQRLTDLKLNLATSDNPFSGVTWCTVHSFKGLENEYILLVEGEGVSVDDWYRSLLYVAITRAKTEFHYFGDEADEIWSEVSNAKRGFQESTVSS